MAADQQGSGNPFAGGINRASMSGASDDSELTHRMFGSAYVLSDDDPVSPTWVTPSSCVIAFHVVTGSKDHSGTYCYWR